MDDLPHSIFEIDGARECATSFAVPKTAGLRVRAAYTVVPKELKREGMSLNQLWARRQSTKFNGAPYIVQKGAAAIYTEQGKKEIRSVIDY